MKPSDIKSAPLAVQELYREACLVRERAYAPYSGYSVGAAIRTRAGQVFSGCNVENSSYGATTCAERGAIQKAISEVGKIQLAEVMVVSDANPPWPPCGMCRQVIVEFAESAEFGERGVERNGASSAQLPLTIYLANLDGALRTFLFRDLFPESFDVNYIK